VKRERGNVATNISANITINRPLVPITAWKFQFLENGGSWSDTGFSGSFDPGTTSSFNTGTTTHSPNVNANNVRYRVVVTDSFQESASSAAPQINFLNLIFHGPSEPNVGASQVRGLSGRLFTDGPNPFDLQTGAGLTTFVVALPSPLVVSQVLDKNVSNANITSEYVLDTGLTSIPNFADISTSYNVYIMRNSIPYGGSGHLHQITRTT
jgi:hypothetical protein